MHMPIASPMLVKGLSWLWYHAHLSDFDIGKQTFWNSPQIMLSFSVSLILRYIKYLLENISVDVEVWYESRRTCHQWEIGSKGN